MRVMFRTPRWGREAFANPLFIGRPPAIEDEAEYVSSAPEESYMVNVDVALPGPPEYGEPPNYEVLTLRSPNGTIFRVGVSDRGELVTFPGDGFSDHDINNPGVTPVL